MNASACYRGPHVSQFTSWGDPPIFEARAVETGEHTHYSLMVRRLEIWVVEAYQAAEPQRLRVYRTPGDAMHDAQELLMLPDRRGIARQWVVSGEAR